MIAIALGNAAQVGIIKCTYQRWLTG